jgi:hypothetical protein
VNERPCVAAADLERLDATQRDTQSAGVEARAFEDDEQVWLDALVASASRPCSLGRPGCHHGTV